MKSGEGRPPKPVAVKRAEGNPGKRRLTTARPRVVKTTAAVPRPPEWIDGVARQKYRQLAAVLADRGLLQAEDEMMLAIACQDYSDYRAARKQFDTLKGTGKWLVRVPGGSVTQNPLMWVLSQKVESLRKASVQFGFGPVDRARFGLDLPSRNDMPKEDPLDSLLKQTEAKPEEGDVTIQ